MKKVMSSFLLLAATVSTSVLAADMTVYKSPYCGCCEKWIDKVEASGFSIEKINSNNMQEIKEKFQVPHNLQSCHTAIIDGYVVEGHVPVKDIQTLLEKKQMIKGIATPGMPQSAPGMDVPGAKDTYQVIAFNSQGQQRVVNEYNSK